MPILKVANVHFISSATSRLEYNGGNTINLVANTNGITITQNAFSPIQSNTISLGTSNLPIGNIHMANATTLHFGSNVKVSYENGNVNFKGAGHSYSFDKIIMSGLVGTKITMKKRTTQFFNANGTWTKPDGCRFIKVVAQGGGGGGGAAYESYGGGGAGGAIGIKWLNVSDWSNTTTVTIGSGGGGDPGMNGDTGATGNTTSFGTHITAPGAFGGTVMPAGTSFVFYRGGNNESNAFGGDLNIPVSGGNFAIRLSGTNANGAAGNGGKSFFWLTAPGGNGGTGEFSAESYWGGGGGGASSGTSGTFGGNGGNGFVLVEEYY